MKIKRRQVVINPTVQPWQRGTIAESTAHTSNANPNRSIWRIAKVLGVMMGANHDLVKLRESNENTKSRLV